MPYLKTTGSRTGPRINLFFFFLLLVTGLIIYRLFNLTYIQHASFVQSAKEQYSNPSALIAGRGNIYLAETANGGRKLAATNRSTYYVYCNNRKITSAHDLASILAVLIDKDRSALEADLQNKDKTYNILAQDLGRAQADKIKSLKLAGVSVAAEVNRYYTQGSAAAHLLGFVGFDGKRRSGQYGVEASYDEILSGEKKTLDFLGNKTYSSIARLAGFFSGNKNKNPPEAEPDKQEGSDIVLTVDQNIQSVIELKLSALLKKWSAAAGTIIVENPATGEILGMATSPSFDPNRYSDYKLGDFVNPDMQAVFEPGSSFKPITMSGAIDSGVVTPDTTYEDTGEAHFGTYVIKNFNEKANGIQTMRQVLEHSLNTGAMFAENKTGDDAFLNYVVGFGFGQKSGIDLPGEVSGNISNLYSGRKINFATASFGQGIAVTPLQLINGYSAIANGGRLMWPHVVKEIVRPDGAKTEIKPKVIGAPIKDTTARQLQSMLVDVVDKGFDKARVAGYDVAGKTGTAQIPDGKGGYLGSDQFIHDFVGFAPAYNPRFVILIKMDRPKGIKFAADSLSPVFGDLARYLIHYFNIPPTRN